MKRDVVTKVMVFVGLVALAAGTRLMLIAPNFHAVTAAALFAGFYFKSRVGAACVPIVAMTASNWILGGYHGEVMIAVYASLIVPILWRSVLRARLTAPRVALAALSSTAVFFLATNAAVWHAGQWYPRTLEGLLSCYAAAVPFLYNAIEGDLVFTALLFGAYALATHGVGAVARPSAVAK